MVECVELYSELCGVKCTSSMKVQLSKVARMAGDSTSMALSALEYSEILSSCALPMALFSHEYAEISSSSALTVSPMCEKR